MNAIFLPFGAQVGEKSTRSVLPSSNWKPDPSGPIEQTLLPTELSTVIAQRYASRSPAGDQSGSKAACPCVFRTGCGLLPSRLIVERPPVAPSPSATTFVGEASGVKALLRSSRSPVPSSLIT